MIPDTSGPDVCKCGRAWVIHKIKIDDNRTVRNYWCRQCDGLPQGTPA